MPHMHDNCGVQHLLINYQVWPYLRRHQSNFTHMIYIYILYVYTYIYIYICVTLCYMLVKHHLLKICVAPLDYYFLHHASSHRWIIQICHENKNMFVLADTPPDRSTSSSCWRFRSPVLWWCVVLSF